MRNLRAMLGFDVRNLAGLGWGALALLGLAIVLRIAGSFQTALPMLTTLGFITVLQPFTADALPGLRRLYVAAPVSRRTVIASHYLTGAAVYVVTVALLVVIALP